MKTRPTAEQMQAVRIFAARHGRTWKAELRSEWMNACQGVADQDEAGLLQQIRNTCGPQWLKTASL